MRNRQLHSLVVKLLGVVYAWIGRHYQRERFREELWRIGQELGTKRRTEAGERATRGGQSPKREFPMRQARHGISE
jgi:hypothetical protein